MEWGKDFLWFVTFTTIFCMYILVFFFLCTIYLLIKKRKEKGTTKDRYCQHDRQTYRQTKGKFLYTIMLYCIPGFVQLNILEGIRDCFFNVHNWWFVFIVTYLKHHPAQATVDTKARDKITFSIGLILNTAQLKTKSLFQRTDFEHSTAKTKAKLFHRIDFGHCTAKTNKPFPYD